MNTIEELIQKECPEGVEYLPLELLTINITAPLKLKTNQYKSSGRFPIIDQGQKDFAGYTDDENSLLNSDEYILYGDHTCTVKYYNGQFAQGADGLKILKSKNCNTKYLYYALCSFNLNNTEYKRHWTQAKEIEIPVPPLSVQHKIVEILDKFTSLEAELQAELEARKKQYEYYRNQLLDFTGREDVEWKTLGEVANVVSGGTPSKNKEEYWANGNIKWLSSTVCQNDKRVNSVSAFITEEGLKKSSAKMMKPGTTLIALVGATIGKVAFLDFEAAINQNIAGVWPKDDGLDEDYLYYACNSLYSQFLSLTNGKLAMANLSFVRNLTIPIPSLTEQQRIVTILDKFEALINGQTASLAAEIKARHQQYEYYRDRLLTFSRKEN